ncbi:DUF4377 domain-containing protein [Carboxylicivirga sp. N1Y90]|uniref:DUF4377 domain-containing protein n=1 Tax=Carboxylicivirga fragile TaxID=3417571 RepID=UPI003D34840A|nr:DUF4377 domain-containing protein [Marinilabiliaceae bacterium N1Y90]
MVRIHTKSIALIMLIIFVACSITKKNTSSSRILTTEVAKTYYVAPYKVNCTGVSEQSCLLVKHNIDAKWNFFYDNIDGFSHQAGYTYILKVKESPMDNPPADASNIRYELMEIKDQRKVRQDLISIYDIWGIVALNGQSTRPSKVFQSIEINTQKLKIMGEAGCNSYSAQLKAEDGSNKFSISQLTITNKQCDFSKIEEEFLEALQRTETFYRFNNTLLLLANNQILIEARRMD